MDKLFVAAAELGVMVLWIVGVVLASGWLKALAIFFPPYALYLCVERAMTMMGVL